MNRSGPNLLSTSKKLDSEHIQWTKWQPLYEAWKGKKLPSVGGLYRIRRMGFDGLDYIGQTGKGTMTLKKRIAMLKGVWGNEMPYRDPHTAGPALWALRHKDGSDFEISVSPMTVPTPKRKGLEALAQSLYRQEWNQSPTLNFGRMPAGYLMSSANNSKLVSAGKRFRGGPSNIMNASHELGLPPEGPLESSFIESNWCGHRWTDWKALEKYKELKPSEIGLYRVIDLKNKELFYIGEGKIRSRLESLVKKTHIPGHSQGELLNKADEICFSYVVNATWKKHQRLELENDLIAAHVLYHSKVPTVQFLG